MVVAADCLPFPSNSIDGIVLHHVLEVGADPRAVLREVQRVLQPGGRVIICGFNSLSFWGVLRWRNTFRGLMPLSSIRIQDWISVLGIHRDQPVRYLNCYGRTVRRMNGRSFGWVAEKLRRIPFPCAVVSHPLPRKRNNRDNADLHLPSQHSNRRRFFSLPYRSRQNERPDLSGNLALQGFSNIGRPDLVSTNVFYLIYSAYTVIQQRPTSTWAATLAHISLSFHLTVVFRPSTFNQDL